MLGLWALDATFNTISVMFIEVRFYWWRKLEYPEKATCPFARYW